MATPPHKENRQSVQIWFSGHVQGVGFRYQTLTIARQFDVTGTVSNLNDSRVFLQVTGQPSEVAAFLAEIQRQMQSFIRKTETAYPQELLTFKGFQIVS